MDNHEIAIFDVGHYRNEDGPGIRTIVFFKGCPLRCAWCSNPFGLTGNPQSAFNRNLCVGCGACVRACRKECNRLEDGKAQMDFTRCDACGECIALCPAKARRIIGEKLSVAKLFDMIIKDASFYRRTKGGITLSGGEVLLQCEAAAELLRKCRGCLFLSIAIETSAYGPWECLETLAGYCDLVFADLKFFDRDKHIKHTGVPNDLILENIKRLCEMSAEKGSPKVVVRRPIIPGINDDDETTIAAAKYVGGLPGRPEINLLPYHNLGESKYDMIGRDYKLEKTDMISPSSPIMMRIRDLTLQYAPENRVSIGGGEIEG